VTRQVLVTERVLAELTGVRVAAWCCRRAELVGVLRFAGQLHPMGGRVVVLARVGSLAAAVRVQRGLYEVYGCRADVLGPDSRPLQVNTGTPPRGTTAAVGHGSGGHRVLITTGGAELARRTGLTDRAGRGLRGLPPQLVAGRVCDVAALWRGAFTPRSVAALVPRIEQIADELIAAIPTHTGPVDLLSAFAFPLPITVICELLGIPATDRDQFRAWTNTILFAGSARSASSLP